MTEAEFAEQMEHTAWLNSRSRDSESLPNKLTINGTEYINANQYTIGDIFCDMDAQEQATVLDTIAKATAHWEGRRFVQWEYMREHMSPDAVRLIREWAEYFIPENDK